MALFPSRSLLLPLSAPSVFPFKPSATSFPKLPFYPPKARQPILSSASSSNNRPPSPFTSEQAVLEAVAHFDADEKSLPAVRTYENDLARLTLVGAVDFQQALTAAAADGGEAADEHISSGIAAMVVETVFPGPADDHSTVSTRLFLPARKVKEKAIRLKKSLTKDMLHGASSKNILAMTFRQVVLQQLWSLELALFRPGSERNMDNLENPREVPVLLTLSSSDESIISKIGEVVCLAAFENTQRHILHDSVNKASNRFFSWFNKHKRVSSRDSSVVLHNFLEHEMLANVRMLLEKFNLERRKNKLKGTKLRNSLWMSPTFSKLEKIGGAEFCAWISECVPSYMLEIDANKHGDVKFEGWKKSEENRWGVVLTHSQMVNLADILDMYYEDMFTLPNKRLSCHAVAKPSNSNLNKGSSLLNRLSIVVASGIFLVTLSVLGKLYLPHLPMKKNYIQENFKAPSSDISFVPLHSMEVSEGQSCDSSGRDEETGQYKNCDCINLIVSCRIHAIIQELEMCCVSIVRRIKDSFGWPGEIRKNSGVCAWIGELPKFLRVVDDTDSSRPDISSASTPLGASEDEMKQLQDIASYQVMVSTDGKIVGFQPTNRVAVNNWAANPLAKELYGGKNLSPGLLEPGLNISPPNGVILLELLISSNPDFHFAMVRTVDINGKS